MYRNESSIGKDLKCKKNMIKEIKRRIKIKEKNTYVMKGKRRLEQKRKK